MLTDSEYRAIRYYTGDTEGNDPFWGDDKAYVALNALFFPGIRTESDRAAEGKRLNPALLDDPERLRRVLCDLLSACRKCALPEEQNSFRVERFSDYTEMCIAGSTISFTSTSTAGFLQSYTDRKGIALLAFSLPAGTPCIPMAEVLPRYAKAEEAEILLPPHLELSIQEREIPTQFRTITDADGKPPVIYAEATAAFSRSLQQSIIEGRSEAAACCAGKRVYKALMDRKQPDPEDIALYTEWKKAFIQSLW